MMVKKEIRVIGIDDSPFNKFRDKQALVVGVVMRGGSFVDGILSAKVDVDGNDATYKLIGIIEKSKFRSQLRCIFLNGIAVAGFDVIDIVELSRKTKIPVVIIIRQNPDIEAINSTLTKLNKGDKIEIIKNAGEVKKIGKIYVQFAGIEYHKVMEILKLCCTRSLVPEPLRLAHIIGQGIVLGESRGRA